MSYQDIAGHVKELYGIQVSTATISSITDKIIDAVKQWQQRPLDSHYPFIWLDAIHYKIRDNGRYPTKANKTYTPEFKQEAVRLMESTNQYDKSAVYSYLTNAFHLLLWRKESLNLNIDERDQSNLNTYD